MFKSKPGSSSNFINQQRTLALANNLPDAKKADGKIINFLTRKHYYIVNVILPYWTNYIKTLIDITSSFWLLQIVFLIYINSSKMFWFSVAVYVSVKIYINFWISMCSKWFFGGHMYFDDNVG